MSITIQKANWYLHLLTRKGRKVKEYRAYYMGGKCYRYIGPDKKCIPMVQERVMDVCQEWQRNYIIKEGVILSWRTKRMNQLKINSISDWL